MVGRDLQNTDGMHQATRPGKFDSYAFIGLQCGTQFDVTPAQHHLVRALVAVANAWVGCLLK
jgi:hypothetical protein